VSKEIQKKENLKSSPFLFEQSRKSFADSEIRMNNKKSIFKLEKDYLDCIDNEGNCFIVPVMS